MSQILVLHLDRDNAIDDLGGDRVDPGWSSMPVTAGWSPRGLQIACLTVKYRLTPPEQKLARRGLPSAHGR
jgi:hypothetical protein